MCRVYTDDGIRLIGALAAAGDESGSQGADDPLEEAPTRTYSGRRAPVWHDASRWHDARATSRWLFNFSDKSDELVGNGLCQFVLRSQASPDRPLKLVQWCVGAQGRLIGPSGMIWDNPSPDRIV